MKLHFITNIVFHIEMDYIILVFHFIRWAGVLEWYHKDYKNWKRRSATQRVGLMINMEKVVSAQKLKELNEFSRKNVYLRSAANYIGDNQKKLNEKKM